MTPNHRHSRKGELWGFDRKQLVQAIIIVVVVVSILFALSEAGQIWRAMR